MYKTSESFTTLKIKKENPDEDDGNMKEFAETAMNELLGWYGYGTNREESSGKVRSSSSNSHRESNSPDNTESPKYTDGCEWCGKAVHETKGLSSSASGAVFCSELCFSQSRRANFKKNKTCDWCRHVRHTISYVDFQDGVSQLQFCSTKCLNQYKMHIFCRETRAHLEMHPHMPDDPSMSTANLITPDLWLQNCKSPEPCNSVPSNPSSPKISDPPQTSPLPLLTLAHPSKLMDSPRLRSKIQKKPRKRCRSTIPALSPLLLHDVPQDLRVRQTPPQVNHDSPNCGDKNSTEQRTSATFFNSPQTSKSTYCPSTPNVLPTPSVPLKTAGLLPPVTIIVPYPIVIPLPIPIPIPIPLSKDDFERLTKQTNNDTNKPNTLKENGNEESCGETTDMSENTSKPIRKRRRLVLDTKSNNSEKNKKFVPV